MGWFWRLVCARWPTLRVIPPACPRCGGSGLDCALEEVACWSCNGSGNAYGQQFLRMRLTPELLKRVAMGEFRRYSP